MRRILLPLLLLIGCWDFESLHRNSPPEIDGSTQDLTGCPERRTPQIEDCTNRVDDNDDCLADCDDPQCADHVACLGQPFLGYGNLVTRGTMCQSDQKSKDISSNPMPQSDCAGCSCNGTCNTTFRSFDPAPPTDCQNNNNNAKREEIALKSTNAAGSCFNLGMTNKDFVYRADQAAMTCMPAGTPTPVTNFGTQSTLCYQTEPCTRFSCIKNASKSCIAVQGDIACPSEFPVRTVWGTGVNDTRTCTACTCMPKTQQCAFANADLKFYEATNCGMSSQNYGGTCNAINLGGMKPALSVRLSTVPDCQSSSTAPMDNTKVTLVEPITICCIQ